MDKCYIIDTSHLADKSNQVIYDMLRNQLANKELILFHQNNHNAINSAATLSFYEAMGFSILPFSYIEQVKSIPNDIRQYVKSSTMYHCESDIVSKIIQTMKPLIQISMPNHIEWLHNNRMNLFYWLVNDGNAGFSENKYKKIQHWLEQDNFRTILNNKSQWQSLFHSKLHERKMKIAMILNGEPNYQDAIDKLIARRILAELHQYFKLPIWFELIVHHNNKNLISNDLSLAVYDEQLNYVHLTRKIVKLFTILTYAVMAQSQSKHLYHAWIALKERNQEVVDFIIAYMKLHDISVNVNNLPNFKKAWLDLFEIYDEHEVKTCFTNFLNGQPLKPSAIYEQPKPPIEKDTMDNPIEEMVAKDFEGLVRPSTCQRNDLTLNMNNLINEIGNHLCELFPQIQITHGQGSSLSSDSFAKLDTATQIWFSDVMQQSNNALKQNEQFQLHTLHMMMCDIVDDLRWIKAFLKHKPNLSYSWSLDTDDLTWQALHHHITIWARGWRESFGFKSDAEEQELQRIADEQKAKEEAERLKQEEQQRQEMEQKEMNTAFENKIKAFEERRKQGLVVYNEITLLGLETVKEHIQMCLGVNYYDIQLGLIRVDDLKSKVWMRSNLEQIILKAIQDLMEQVDKYEPLTYLFRQNFEAEKAESNKFVALTVGRNKEIKSAVSNGIAIFALMKQQFIIIRNLAQLIQFNISTPLDEPLTSLESRITGLQQQCHQQLNSL